MEDIWKLLLSLEKDSYLTNIRIKKTLLPLINQMDPEQLGEKRSGGTFLFWAVVSGVNDIVKAVLKKRANLNNGLKDIINEPFVFTGKCSQKHRDNCHNYNNHTPLEISLFNGTIDISKMLIEEGANVNRKAPNGNTAWATAVRYSNFDPYEQYGKLVELFLKHGADLYATYDGIDILEIINHKSSLVYKLISEARNRKAATATARAIQHAQRKGYLPNTGSDITRKVGQDIMTSDSNIIDEPKEFPLKKRKPDNEYGGSNKRKKKQKSSRRISKKKSFRKISNRKKGKK